MGVCVCHMCACGLLWRLVGVACLPKRDISAPCLAASPRDAKRNARGAGWLTCALARRHGGISAFCSRRPLKKNCTAPLKVIKVSGSNTQKNRYSRCSSAAPGWFSQNRQKREESRIILRGFAVPRENITHRANRCRSRRRAAGHLHPLAARRDQAAAWAWRLHAAPHRAAPHARRDCARRRAQAAPGVHARAPRCARRLATVEHARCGVRACATRPTAAAATCFRRRTGQDVVRPPGAAAPCLGLARGLATSASYSPSRDVAFPALGVRTFAAAPPLHGGGNLMPSPRFARGMPLDRLPLHAALGHAPDETITATLAAYGASAVPGTRPPARSRSPTSDMSRAPTSSVLRM